MKRKRFVKIMQSKGLQRNEAESLAKEVCNRISEGLSYELISHGTITRYPCSSFAIKYSEYDAFLVGRAFQNGTEFYRSPSKNEISEAGKLWLNAPSENVKRLLTLGGEVPSFINPFCI